MTSRLVQRLLNDVGDNPDYLPILQHALMRTWDRWLEDGPCAEVDLPHYEAIGMMTTALSQHAEEVYAELPDDRSRAIAEKLFKALTDKSMDNRGVRRPTRLDELCAVASATEAEVMTVIETFRQPSCSFLMPPGGSPSQSGFGRGYLPREPDASVGAAENLGGGRSPIGPYVSSLG